ncbi:MAG: nucleotidyl transferase AbiEii/AbiGii toxin family protein [Candidatus Buchananbacteria bacterium]|jgi:hypothetical protein
MFYDILDGKRRQVLPLLKNFKADFYLAGGTGLALQLGHRDSIDFDFFSPKAIDTVALYKKIKEIFTGHKIEKVQEEKDTLTVFIDDGIKMSFFSYDYELIGKVVNEENLNIASIIDIACMKLSAIVSRATNKDYVDLYFILQNLPLGEILPFLSRKFPDMDVNLALKSLVYFKDVKKEPIKFKHQKNIDFASVKSFLEKQAKNYS